VAKRYRHVDAALLRAATHTADVVPQTWPESDHDTDSDRWCEWLMQVWPHQASIAQAVALASPTLADQIERVCDGQRPRVRRAKRLALSLARYLVRMRGRAHAIRDVRRRGDRAVRPADHGALE
jgi:hypothetical protein